MTRVCIIGAGGHSRSHHGPSLKQLRDERPDEIELAAVCDLDADRAQSYALEYGFRRTYRDFDAMIDTEKPDALIAVTPLDLTVSLVGRLLPYGIPIELEKPPGRTLEQAEELAAAVRDAGTPHMISFNRRFNPAVIAAKRRLAEEDLRVEHIVARMLRVRRLETDFVLGTGVHLIDTTLSFLDGAEHVQSRRWATSGAGQHAAAVIANERGQSAHLEILPDAGAMEETYELAGSGFFARIDTGAGTLVIHRDGQMVVKKDFGDAPLHVSAGAYDETKAFLDAVATGTPFSPDMSDGLLAMRTADAIERGGTTILKTQG